MMASLPVSHNARGYRFMAPNAGLGLFADSTIGPNGCLGEKKQYQQYKHTVFHHESRFSHAPL
jgi:hypothetical protein